MPANNQPAPLGSEPRIPDYELVRHIGGGSYGDVWLARNVMGTYRAVKVIYRARFDHDRPYEREFEGIRNFEPISRAHESQVDILHIGRNDAEGYFYYVMELADDGSSNQSSVISNQFSASKTPAALGTPLNTDDWKLITSSYVPRTLAADLKQRGKLPVDECIQLGLSLATALEHLHVHGLIHRDIKPSNIIFVNGLPKLADIGLVTETDQTMSFVGTAGYLPPEGPGTVQGDIYSLGKVLYEACTGKDRQEFPELPSALGALPEEASLLEFNEIVVRACHHDPRQRYSSAQALFAELSLLQEGESVIEKRHRERLASGAKKMAAILALALLVGTVGYFVRNPAHTPPLAPQRLLVDNAEFWRTPDYPRQFDFAPAGESIRIVFAGVKGLSIWDDQIRINRPLNVRGLEGWQFLVGPGALPRWAPNGRDFIFQALKKTDGLEVKPMNVCSLFLANADTGECRRIGPELHDGERVGDLSWLPDGQAVTYISHDRRIYTLSLATGARTLWVDSNLPGHGRPLLGDYSPDGKWLPVSLATGPDAPKTERDIWLMPHPGGRAIPLTDTPGFDAYATWAPDGETVYYISAGGRPLGNTWGIRKVRIDRNSGAHKGPITDVFIKNGEQLLHPRFVARGKKLAYAGAAPKTDVWIATSDQMDQPTQIVRGQAPVLSTNGKTVYFVGETREQQGVYAIDRNGRGPKKLCDLIPLGEHFPRSGLSLSPDGELLAMFSFDQKKLGVFTVPTTVGAPRLVEELTEWELIHPVWSPDGQWLSYPVDKVLYRVSRDGKVREALATLYRWQGWSVRWSPDGNWVAALAYATPKDWSEKVAVFAVSVADKQVRKLTPDSEDKYKEGLEWHPDLQRLTYFFYGPGKFDAKIKWAFLHEPGKTEEMIDQAEYWDYVGVWAPDGRRFVFQSSNTNTGAQGIHSYDLHTTNITPRLRGGWLPAWSRDGKTVVWTTGESERYFEVLDDFR